MRQFIALIALLAPPATAALAGPPDDFQYRSRLDLRWLDTTNWVATTWGEMRWTHDASRFTNWRVSQSLQYNPSPALTFGVGYTFIEQDGFDSIAQSDAFRDTHRAEFDVIPRFQLADDLRLNWRVRFENRWIDGRGGWNPQFRTKPELVFALHGAGPLAEVFASDEIFYDLKQDLFAENRFIPAGLSWSLGRHARLRIYYLLDSVNGANGWVNLHVLQTQLTLSLR